MTEIKRWEAPGRDQGKDKPVLIFPAAGWYDLKSKKGFAGPGWLVTHPDDPVTSAGMTVGYYLRNEAGQLTLAWAEAYESLEIEGARRQIIIRSRLGYVQVVQYMDSAAGLLTGFTVEEWRDPRPQPKLASEAVVKAITEWEAVAGV